jgi:cytochrome c556
MSVEALTYSALAERLDISPEAARSLAKRLRLPRSLSSGGKALVSVDLGEITHRRRSPVPRGDKIEALRAQIARLHATAAMHRADFERERERADRLTVELIKASAETASAKEAAARLEGEVAALEAAARGESPNRLRRLAAAVVEADRRACK